ncbi:hypothetical protein [Hymenobacter fodinae]|uniref:Uncharacterized protein n=1 Tax=Hymenobacter fodinae TaxID=2510796 RepID=A0A4Z0P7R1_9BACT|nr:hypothetical protein [Hymenobacter fodinae]TGE08341.1 hypothetical protein EU556_11535 [Hymenobacter fodinae]
MKKAVAIAEIEINLMKEILAINANVAANSLNIPTAGVAGISQSAILTGIAVAKAGFATAKVLAFAEVGCSRAPATGRVAFHSRWPGVLASKRRATKSF